MKVLRAVIYTRVSTDRQAEEGFSLEAQHDRLVEYVRIQGWDLIRIYTDPGVSAKDLNRPGVKEMLTDLKTGKFDILLVHKLDRLTRNIGDLYDLVELVNTHEVKLVSLSENIDTSTPMGRMFVYLLGIFAQMFRENLREEVLKGMTTRAEKGLRNGSHAPYGYDEVDDELVVNEEKAHWVRQIFQWYTENQWGYGRIAKELNRLGVRGGRGGFWHENIVEYILKNPSYIGVLRWRDVVVEGSNEPIIDEETFHRAQELMRRRSLKEIPRSSRDAHPFSGIIRCGECGYPFHGRILRERIGNYYNYRCYGKQKMKVCKAPDISERKLEKLFFEHVRLIRENIELGKAETAASSSSDVAEERRRIERELKKSETRRKNWQYAMGDGKLPYEDYVKLIDEEMARVSELQRQLEELPEGDEQQPVTPQELMDVIINMMDNWRFIEATTKKNILQSLYKKIVIKKENGRWTITEMVPN